MYDILMTPLRLGELETLIENSLRKVLTELPTSQQPLSDKLMSITEAAKFLGLKVPTLYSKASQGTIPYSKQAGRLYFIQSELQKWIQEGRRLTQKELTHQTLDNLSKKKVSRLS